LKRIVIAVIAAAGLALGLGVTAGAAGASPAAIHPAGISSFLRYTNANGNPVSGWEASAPGVGFTHIQSYVGSNDSNSLSQLTNSPNSGGKVYAAGVGLCNRLTPSMAYALQAGVEYDGANHISVVYGHGLVAPVDPTYAQDNNDPCELGAATGLVNTLDLTVAGPVASSDTVWLQILYSNTHSFTTATGVTCHKGEFSVEAEDVTANPGDWFSSGCTYVGNHTFSEADAGVVDATTNVSAPASNYLATFAHIGLTDTNGDHGSFQANSNWTVYPVDSTGTGNGPDSLALLHADTFFEDHFNEWIGSPTG
jgi:hypothetical protein